MSIVKIRAALEAQLATIVGIIPAVSIASMTVGATAVFTTSTAHGLQTGLLVTISNFAGSSPVIDGDYYAIVTGIFTFTLQNTATKSNIGAILTGNGGSIKANLTVTPNSVWQGPLGIPYQRLDLLTAKPGDPTQGGGYRREQGIFRVMLVYPLGVGTGAIMSRAELIRSAFQKGSSLVNDGITVVIPTHPELGSEYSTLNNYSIPVKIEYYADIYS